MRSAPFEQDVAGMLRRFVEASRRAEIIALVNSARTVGEVAQATIDELCEALEAEISFVVVTRPDRGERAMIGATGLSAAESAAVSGEFLVRSALGTTRARAHDGVDLLGIGVRRLALAPFAARNGRRGVIGVARLYDEHFDPAEVALLEAVTASAGHALERSWLAAERDRHAIRQAALARAATAMSATLVRHEVLQRLSSEVADALEADVVAVLAVDAARAMELVAASGLVEPPARVPVDASGVTLHTRVLGTGRSHVRQPSRPGPVDEVPGSGRLGSAVAAPIRPRDRVEGVVFVGYRGDRWIEREDVELLAAFAELAGIAWNNASVYAAAQEAAARDSLTGCLNHGAFQDLLRAEMARADRDGGSLAVALVDLDDFKAVNDDLGHLAGDALLRGVADALRRSVRPYDHVARYGGDEFALLLPSIDEAGARRVVDRALAAVRAVSPPEQGRVTATAGVAHWRAGEPANALIARADRCLLDQKRARKGGRGRVPGWGGASSAPPDERRQRRLETAGTLGMRLARLLDQRAIAETAIIELGAALGYDRCTLVRRSPEGPVRVVAAAAVGDQGPATEAPVSEVLQRALRERRTVLARGPRDDGTDWAELAVPVHVGGELWGALGVQSARRPGFDDDAQLVQRLADHLGAALRTAELYEQLERTHLGTAEALAAALEATDGHTADHARSVTRLAVAVGGALEFGENDLRDLRFAAIFRDIGKSAIPEAILAKTEPLTRAELEVVRRHPVVGEQILAPVPFLAGVRRIVRHDHERWDGRGYPDGLSGTAIPVGARIVAVVDAYAAMRTDRPYRGALSGEQARAELRSHAGTQFDPQIVDVLLGVLEREPAAGHA